MAAIRTWMYRRFRLITGIPLLVVIAGIGLQALLGVGDFDTYLLQGAGWVAYLALVVGVIETDVDVRSLRKGRGGRRRDRDSGDDVAEEADEAEEPQRPRAGRKRSSGTSTKRRRTARSSRRRSAS